MTLVGKNVVKFWLLSSLGSGAKFVLCKNTILTPLLFDVAL